MASLLQRRDGAVLVALAAFAPLPVAARTVFDPQLEVGASATNNVTYQGEGSSDKSDIIGVLAATLALTGESPQNQWNFRYRPEVQRYQDFDDLDHDEHRVDLDWSTALGRRSRLGTQATWELTQTQGIPEQIGDPDLFATPRTDRQYGHLNFTLNREQSRLWSWNLSGGAQAHRYDAIEGLIDPVGTTLEDREEYAAAFGLTRQHSAKTAVGGVLRWEHFDLEQSGEEDTVTLAATWDYQVGRTLSLTAESGVFWLSGEAGVDQESRWGLSVSVDMERRWADRLLRLRLDNEPSSGGALTGSSIDSALTLTYGSAETPTWNWELSPYVARRTTTDLDQDTIWGGGARVGVGRRLGQHMALELSVDHYGQTGDEEVSTAWAGVLWNPLRRADRPAEP
jgi:hypothetical protein